MACRSSLSQLKLTFPLFWRHPAVRYVYDVAPEIPTLVFSVAYYAVAACGLLAVLAFEKLKSDGGSTEENSTLSIRGGVELGGYLFLGNAFQVFGLRTVPSDRAAFLLQLTTIMVPLVQALLAGSLATISKRVWIASVTALVGVAIISLDGAKSLDTSEINFSGGDLLIVCAAVLYTFHCIRLEIYAKTTSAVKLALTKATTEMSLSLAAAVSLVVCSNVLSNDGSSNSILSSLASTGNSISIFVSDFSSMVQSDNSPGILPAVAATSWIGLVTVAYTICAQSYGQKYVKAATANLLYTTQPLYTAGFAWIVLGETLGPLGYSGGLIILLAVLLVAFDEENSS